MTNIDKRSEPTESIMTKFLGIDQRELSLPVSAAVARERLRSALATPLTRKRDFFSATERYTGKCEGENLLLNVSFPNGRSAPSFIVQGVFSAQGEWACLQLKTRVAYAWGIFFAPFFGYACVAGFSYASGTRGLILLLLILSIGTFIAAGLGAVTYLVMLGWRTFAVERVSTLIYELVTNNAPSTQ